MPNAQLLEPEYSFQLAERNVASEFASFARFQGEQDHEAVRVVRLSAVILELTLLGVCVHEMLDEAAATSVDDATARGIDLAQRVRDRCGIILDDLAEDIIHHLPITSLDPNTVLDAVSIPRLVRFLRSSLEIYPIRQIERIGLAFGQEHWAHRARVAYDALRAFLLRSDPKTREQMKLVGHMYTEGQLTPDAVATLLGFDVEDASFFLEAYGFTRSLERVQMPEARRAEILQAIRSDRLARAGKPTHDPRQVLRDVIASERIEEVDVRPWVQQPQQ